MHTYLFEMLCCPVCHGELSWTAVARSSIRFERGFARCTACEAAYPVRDGIAVFLPPERQSDSLWEETSRQMQFIGDHPEITRQLLESPLEMLSPADQFYRAQFLEARGEYVGARVAMERAQEGLYTPDSRAGLQSQIDYVIERLGESGGPVVDLASGRCYMAEQILRAVDRPVVATDCSLPVLARDRRYFEYWGLYGRTSLLAFDARRTPFRDRSIATMTTQVGLPSIQGSSILLQELRRIVSGTLLAISVFYAPDDESHATAIRRAGM